MARVTQGIVSEDVETSDAFTLGSGYYLIAASVNTGEVFPSTCTLQMRFKNSDNGDVDWFDTDVSFSDPGADYVLASEGVEYRIVSTSATAVVRVEQTLIPGLNYRG